MKKIESHIEVLPNIVPLMPLYGAVLLPNAQIPVPLTEKEYEFILKPAMKNYGFIGIVQPTIAEYPDDFLVPLFQTGSLAQLTDVQELEDSRTLCVFTGVCRFEIKKEIQDDAFDYRRAFVSYSKYRFDLYGEEHDDVDREHLLKILESYFKAMNVSVNWQEIFQAPDQRLITALTMVCPLAARERQALLELPSIKEQSVMISKLMEMGTYQKSLLPSSYGFH